MKTSRGYPRISIPSENKRSEVDVMYYILRLWMRPVRPQCRTSGGIVRRSMAGRANGHSRDQTTTDGVVERGPSGRGGPAAVTGETVTAISRERGGGESHHRCQPGLHGERQQPRGKRKKKRYNREWRRLCLTGSLFKGRMKHIPGLDGKQASRRCFPSQRRPSS